MFKLTAIILLCLILLSLASGAIFLLKDSDDQNRVVTSLTVRIVLSIALIAVLLIGYFTGQLQPHQLKPGFSDSFHC